MNFTYKSFIYNIKKNKNYFFSISFHSFTNTITDFVKKFNLFSLLSIFFKSDTRREIYSCNNNFCKINLFCPRKLNCRIILTKNSLEFVIIASAAENVKRKFIRKK